MEAGNPVLPVSQQRLISHLFSIIHKGGKGLFFKTLFVLNIKHQI